MKSLSPQPRRFRFGLRTLFLVVTVLACWLGYSMNWIRQRRVMMANPSDHIMFVMDWYGQKVSAPGGLWLFGEKGVPRILVEDSDDVPRVQRLFSEAETIYAAYGHPIEPDP